MDILEKYSKVDEIFLKTWDEFEALLEEFRRVIYKPKHRLAPVPSSLLFRGQRDHTWRLLTTLDRQREEPWSLDEYYRLILKAKPQIETFTGKEWLIPGYEDYVKWLNREGPKRGNFPAYDYMVYLRHHNFPSPLLDWTRSPYVAAYFAFNHATESSNYVSVFAFWEMPKIKVISPELPHIIGLGPYVRGHKRHFFQQSEYTTCVFSKNGKWKYASHEDAIDRGQARQDILWKISIPTKEKLKALRRLEEYNLNAFTLFGSEESLMEAIAVRELYLRNLYLETKDQPQGKILIS